MNATKSPKDNVIPFIAEYNYIAIADLEEVLETLEDMDYLSEKGIKFRNELWKMFIKTEEK